MKNHKAKIKYLFSFFLIILFTTTQVSANKIKLSLNLKKGEIFKVELLTEQETGQSVMGQDMSSNSTSLMEYTMEVLEANNLQEYLIKVTLSRIASKSDGGMGSMEYDSDNDDGSSNNPQNKLFNIIVGSTFKIKVNSMGEVVEVLGTESMLEKIKKIMAEIDDPMMTGMMEGSLLQMYGSEVQKSNIGSFLSVLPKKKVKKGNSWKNSSKGQPNMPILTDNIFTLKKIEGNLAHVATEGTISTVDGASITQTAMAMEMDMSYNLSGNLEGEYVIDINTGLIDHSKVEQYIEGDISVSSPQMPETMSIPMSIKSIITIKIIK